MPPQFSSMFQCTCGTLCRYFMHCTESTMFMYIQSDLFTTSPLVVLPYTSIQSDLFTTSALVVLPYTSIQSDLFTTPPLVVLPFTSIQSDHFTTSPLVVLPFTSIRSYVLNCANPGSLLPCHCEWIAAVPPELPVTIHRH